MARGYTQERPADAGKNFVYADITQKLDALTPKQRAAAVELLETYIRCL